MQTFFKNSTQDWYKKVTVLTADPYPNQDKFNQEQLDRLKKDFPDGKTPKSQDAPADSATKSSLDSKTTGLLDWTKVTLIDITAHIEGTKIFGIINYTNEGQHNQLRF